MQSLTKFYMWPIWVVQPFGMSKSFAANPILGSRLLNRFGLHALRVMAAHGASRLRWFLLKWQVPRHLRLTYEAQGFVVVPEFLKAPEFAALGRQIDTLQDCEVRQCIQGDTLTRRVLLDEEAMQKLPSAGKLIDDPLFERLLSFCAANRKRPLHYLQKICNGAASGAADPQKNLHADTFHPTMKSWFFLDDVDADRGPFTFVPGSHRLTRERLAWEYRRSLEAAKSADTYSRRGSFRVQGGELKELCLPPARALEVKANTLVVANTCGFHCRGAAPSGAERREIWSFSRTNPFNILPGLGSKFASRIEYMGAKLYWKWMDRRAEQKGTVSSWHLVPGGALADPGNEA
ncbi:MAG: phytanoyl-CoA dioxygenase family protein [Pseudomonadota bacterium]